MNFLIVTPANSRAGQAPGQSHFRRHGANGALIGVASSTDLLTRLETLWLRRTPSPLGVLLAEATLPASEEALTRFFAGWEGEGMPNQFFRVRAKDRDPVRISVMDRARFASRHMFKRARQLRRDATPEEILLWAELRRTRLGLPIRRQHPLGTVVVDFYCPRAKVAIELDGAHHNANADAERDRMLSTMGIVVVRFENFHIRQNLRGVVTAIRELVLSRAALLREPSSDDDNDEDDWATSRPP